MNIQHSRPDGPLMQVNADDYQVIWRGTGTLIPDNHHPDESRRKA
jgi:hypothetical protein